MITAVLLGAPAAASATTFQLTGVGCVSGFFIKDGQIVAGCENAIDQVYTLAGTVSLDVFGAADGFSADPIGAAGNNWVLSSFQLTWTGPTSGSYASGHVPNETDSGSHAEVYNDPVYGQELFTQVFSASDFPLNGALLSAEIFRSTHSSTWLSDLSFPETAGLAPNPAARNTIEFLDLGYTLDDTGAPVSIRPGSFRGGFRLTSMTAQAVPAAVPEPATLTLTGLGMLGVRIARRHRRA